MTIGITGHQNIPAKALSFVEGHIVEVFNNNTDIKCVSSLAVGADQLFAQLGLSCAATLHVVIPSQQYETSFTTQEDLWQYQALLKQSETSEILNFEHPSEEAFLHAGMRIVDLSDLVVAVWDGEEVKGKGGTADVVKYAQQKGKKLVIIWPEGVKR